MYIDPQATGKLRTIFEWYLSQCYADYTTLHYGAFARRWNDAVESRMFREWVARRSQ